MKGSFGLSLGDSNSTRTGTSPQKPPYMDTNSVCVEQSAVGLFFAEGLGHCLSCFGVQVELISANKALASRPLPRGSKYHYGTYLHGPQCSDIVAPLRPRYIPYTYMNPLGCTPQSHALSIFTQNPGCAS